MILMPSLHIYSPNCALGLLSVLSSFLDLQYLFNLKIELKIELNESIKN